MKKLFVAVTTLVMLAVAAQADFTVYLNGFAPDQGVDESQVACNGCTSVARAGVTGEVVIANPVVDRFWVNMPNGPGIGHWLVGEDGKVTRPP